jgi:hypothetical protein
MFLTIALFIAVAALLSAPVGKCFPVNVHILALDIGEFYERGGLFPCLGQLVYCFKL